MIGAIAGDIIGSIYEHSPIKSTAFELFHADARFTDDTVLTAAVADAIISERSYLEAVRDIGRRYPEAGYGGNFMRWLFSDDTAPYNSWGNGAAMRVSPVGFAFDTEETVLSEAADSARITHDHPEGIKGAQATALAIFLARHETPKEGIRERIGREFGYDLARTVEGIRPHYSFEVSCQRSVPEAIIAFLDSSDWESAVRNAVSLGGDSDTQACIAGGIAEAFYGPVPVEVRQRVVAMLPGDLRGIVLDFEARCRRP